MRIAGDNELIVIAGRRGSGKSVGALDQLSKRSIDTKPWFLLDFKHDDVASRMPITAPPMQPDDDLPEDPGLYAVRCDIDDAGRDSAVDHLLRDIYDHGQMGVMIDEGMFLGQQNAGLRRIAIAGRSRGVPLIFVTQRLMKCDTDVLAEADFVQSFIQAHPDDVDRLGEFIPKNRINMAELAAMGDFHSYIYHTPKDHLEIQGPGSAETEIYERILSRLPVYEDGEPTPQGIVLPTRRVRV